MTEFATFGSGCFWCSEAVFVRVPGVKAVTSGYSGGHVPHPTYEAVCTDKTGHAEVVHVEFDPSAVTYDTLVRLFFRSHDPTTLDRQGHDVGTQYRSVIFTHTDTQQQTATRIQQELDASQTFAAPIVTAIEPFQEFFPAEVSHHNFLARNPTHPYCANIIGPKLKETFREPE